MATAELSIRIQAQDEASKIFHEVSKSAGGFGAALSDVGKIAAGFLTGNVIQGGIGKLTDFFGESIVAAKESAAVQAQLQAALKSTGGAAGESLAELNKMSGGLQDMTNFDDEAIGRAQALLLTFTSIGKDVFPDATSAVLDMSQALGQELKDSSIQLGKALNDPTQGMTALRRVGVSFSEDQQKVIKAMQATGNLAGAQKLILAELNKEFGGSAVAAVKADGGITQLKNKMNDLQEVLGAKLIPVQVKWKELQFDAVNFVVSNAIPAFEQLSDKYLPQIAAAFDDVTSAVGPFIDQIRPFVETLAQNEEVISKVAVVVGGVMAGAFAALAVSAGAAAVGVIASTAPFIAIAAVIAGVALGVRELIIHWDEIKAKFPIVGQAVAYVKEQFADLRVYWDGQLLPALTRIKDRFIEVVTDVVAFVKEHWSLIKDIMLGVVKVAYDELKLKFDLFKNLFKIVVDLINGDWAKAWADLKTLAVDAVNDAKQLVKDAFELWKDIGELLYEVGKAIIDGLWNGMKSKWDDVKGWLSDKMGDLKDSAMSVLGIHSPSTVFYDIGENTMQGYIDGLKAKYGDAQAILDNLTNVTRSNGISLAQKNAGMAGYYSPNDVLSEMFGTTWKQSGQIYDALRREAQNTSQSLSALKQNIPHFDAAANAWVGATSKAVSGLDSLGTAVQGATSAVAAISDYWSPEAQFKRAYPNGVGGGSSGGGVGMGSGTFGGAAGLTSGYTGFLGPLIEGTPPPGYGNPLTSNGYGGPSPYSYGLPNTGWGWQSNPAPVVNVTVQGSVLSERDLAGVIRDQLGAGGLRGIVSSGAQLT
jgi:hypothetical protein